MNTDEYDLKIANAIKTIRKLKGIKQFVIAENINMKECNYNKLEMGRKPLLPSRIKLIANALNCSIIEIFIMAEADI